MSYLSPVREPPQALRSLQRRITLYYHNTAEQGTYTHTDIHKRTHTETKHYDAIFGASKKEFTISTMETAVKCLD